MNHYLLLLLSFNLGIGLVLRLDSVLLIKGVEAVLLIFSTFISLLELVVELLLLEMVLLLYSFCFFISSNSMTICSNSCLIFVRVSSVFKRKFSEFSNCILINYKKIYSRISLVLILLLL